MCVGRGSSTRSLRFEAGSCVWGVVVPALGRYVFEAGSCACVWVVVPALSRYLFEAGSCVCVGRGSSTESLPV